MRISRRQFLLLSATAALGGLAAACRHRIPSTSSVPAPSALGPLPDINPEGEPPLLRERVASGALPPLDDRLPTSPVVVAPYDGTGAYGGALRRGFVQETGSIYQDMRHGRPGQYTTPFFFQGLTAWTADLNLRPNVCEAWEQSDDARTFTYHLRKGLRWSDGQPVTSGDAAYFHERVATHERLGSVFGGSAPRALEVATPDDFTIVFHFERPSPFHPFDVLRDLPMQPSHYLSQWHADLGDRGALDRAAQAEGLPSWAGLYLVKSLWASNPELPVLHTWVPTGETRGSEVVLERNPYFFHVDPMGRQLPYLDHLVLLRFDDPQALQDAARLGALDLQAEELSPADAVTLEEPARDGRYRLLALPSSWHLVLEPNVAYQVEPLHSFLGDRRVREALMVAVDRDAINTICYDGRAKPRQYSPVRGSPYQDEELSSLHVTYAPERAVALLDEAGYAARDGEGWRAAESGEPLSLLLVTTASTDSPAHRAAQLVAGYLEDIGIECAVEQLTYMQFVSRALANRLQLCLTERDYMLMPMVSEYERLFRTVGDLSDQWAGGYLQYRLYGTAQPDSVAIQAPEGHWLREYWALWDQIAEESDERQRGALYVRVLELRKEWIPVIGLLGEAPQPLVIAHGLSNVRSDLPYDLQTGGLALLEPQQLSWENPEQHALETPKAQTPGPEQ